jgi:hypothetical protein
MAMTITATITVADDQPYTPREAAVLAALQAHPSQGAAAVVAAPAPAAEAPAAKAPATRKKAAPAPASASSNQAAVLDTTLDEPAAEEEPEAAEEDLVGGAQEYTLEDAVTAATNLVSAGKSADVKAALAKAGANRVGELKGNAAGLATFMTALA